MHRLRYIPSNVIFIKIKNPGSKPGLIFIKSNIVIVLEIE